MRHPFVPFAFLALCAWLPGQEDQEPAPPTLDAQQVTSGLVEARAKLDTLPGDAASDSPDGFLRQAWERRIQLLDEAAKLLTRAEDLEQAPGELESRRRAYEDRVAQHAKLPAVTVIESPTDDGFEELEARVAAQRDRVTSLRAEETERTQFVENVPALLAQARARLQSAQERSRSLTREAEAATDPAQRELLLTRATNAATDADVARLEDGVLDGERELEKSLAPLRVDERELAERRLERLEEDYRLYREALEQAIDREASRLGREVARLERALESAEGPVERFVAAKRLEVARFAQNAGDHGRTLLSLRSDLEEQARRLAVEVDELQSLRDYLEKAGSGEQAGERIRYTMQRVKLRRQALERTQRRDLVAELSGSRARRFELEDKLFFLKEAWGQQVSSIAVELPGPEGQAFRSTARDLLEPYSDALREEKEVLTELIGVGQELQVALIERRDALDALEAFIRSKVFWLRDARPLGPGLWPRAVEESQVVTAWARDVISPRAGPGSSERATSAGAFAMLLVLLVGLPIALFWVRQRLRRFVTRMNDRTLQRGAKITDRLLAVGGGVLSVALLPAFLLVASRSVDFAGLPEPLVPVLGSFLGHLAVFLLFWFLSRSFFAGRGTAQVQFGMDRDAAHALHRSLCVVLLGYLIFYSTHSILLRPPFFLELQPLETLPRLAYALFLIVAIAALILLLHPRSAFSRYWASTLGGNVFGHRWPLFSGLVCVTGVGIAALEVTGYRYGAEVLARNLVLSLAALFVLVPLYKGVSTALEAYVRARRARRLPVAGESADAQRDPEPEAPAEPAPAGAPGEAITSDRAEFQIRKLVRILFIVGGVVLIAGLWGIDSRAFDALDQLQAYDIRDSGEVNEFVSYGDLLRGVLYVFGTYLVLKYLPGIYEYGVFSRLDFDSGLKYAILTMSRYGVFTVGAILALSAVHLDLGRLSWLMAAVGVGLGFGLQEIVSNFVSGIILLVERPVRVGDLVTVGSTSGRVLRINIRATSVINFDRQEIIVPNRSLITQEVTNWTRGDTIIRLVVPIGVAYGSDVDVVTDTLLELAREQPEILGDPAPQALFLAHGESSLDFELRVFVPDPSVKLSLLHRLNRSINRRLADLGIEIPFPQRDLHIRSSSVEWPARGAVETGEQRARS